MILRRVIEHVKAQNWTAVGLDFVIVVVGVFIGIQVSNWNEANALEKEKARYLQQLSAEYAQVEDLLKDQVADYRAFAAASAQMIKIVKSGGPVARQDIADALDDALSGRIPPDSPATLRELISSGKVDLIDDRNLRTKIMTVHAKTESMARIFDIIRSTLNGLAPKIQLYYDYDTDIDPGDIEPWGTDASTAGIGAIDLEGMRADPSAEATLEIFLASHVNMLQVELEVLGQVSEVNELISAELRNH